MTPLASKYALEVPPSLEVHNLERGVTSIIKEVTMPTERVDSWMMSIYRFLEKGRVPEDEVEAIKIQRMVVNYLIMKGIFYKKLYFTPHLRYIVYPETQHIPRELHEDYATCHYSAKSIIRKVLR